MAWGVKMDEVKQQGPESRERILQAALFLFARNGYAETGVRELATRAEVNLSMVNYFFGSKKGLLKEILSSFFSGYLAIASKTLTGKECLSCRLEKFISSAIVYFNAERDSLIVAISELPHDDAEIIEYKALWATKMLEIVNREISVALQAETGYRLPAAVLAPMLTSLMASRFLFGPLMQKVGQEESSKSVSLKAYTKIIVKTVLLGITGSEQALP